MKLFEVRLNVQVGKKATTNFDETFFIVALNASDAITGGGVVAEERYAPKRVFTKLESIRPLSAVDLVY